MALQEQYPDHQSALSRIEVGLCGTTAESNSDAACRCGEKAMQHLSLISAVSVTSHVDAASGYTHRRKMHAWAVQSAGPFTGRFSLLMLSYHGDGDCRLVRHSTGTGSRGISQHLTCTWGLRPVATKECDVGWWSACGWCRILCVGTSALEGLQSLG